MTKPLSRVLQVEIASCKAYTDAELLEAIRREEPQAFVEFLARFERLVMYSASRAGIHESELADFVSDFLHDVVIALARSDAVTPRSLAGYLAVACRNRVVSEFRSRAKLALAMVDLQDSMADDTPPRPNSTSTVGEDDVHAVVRKVGQLVDDQLSNQEREMIVWSSEFVPLRIVAKWHGISRATAAQRLWRLRKRLEVSIEQIINHLSPADQVQFGRAFRKTLVSANLQQNPSSGPSVDGSEGE